MINGSVKLITANRDLVTKVYIPKYILLLSKSFTYLFKMGISVVITFVLMIFQGVPFTWNILFMVPIFAVVYIFAFGVGMILMHYGVTLNDLGNLTNIALRMVFYLSGIFYNINERLQGSIRYLLLRVNPIAFCMNELRKVLLQGKMPSFEGLGIWLLISLGLCLIGINLIHKNENSYAKVI